LDRIPEADAIYNFKNALMLPRISEAGFHSDTFSGFGELFPVMLNAQNASEPLVLKHKKKAFTSPIVALKSNKTFSKAIRSAQRIASGKRVAAACNSCKKARTRCDESRPCKRCLRLERGEICSFDASYSTENVNTGGNHEGADSSTLNLHRDGPKDSTTHSSQSEKSVHQNLSDHTSQNVLSPIRQIDQISKSNSFLAEKMDINAPQTRNLPTYISQDASAMTGTIAQTKFILEEEESVRTAKFSAGSVTQQLPTLSMPPTSCSWAGAASLSAPSYQQHQHQHQQAHPQFFMPTWPAAAMGATLPHLQQHLHQAIPGLPASAAYGAPPPPLPLNLLLLLAAIRSNGILPPPP
jgi:hypothetical protein